ncbi:hypothetical protein [Streptomyces sp. NPDC014995]|uniref:hypothetical protein n=1 Tax=Streptomyces sp. NPDC014995 TaxID=3364936 RepID=UPI003702F430
MASDAVDLPTVLEEFSRRYGRPRNLAMGGYVDPTVTERTGLPLLAPFAGEMVELRGWASGSRWIGCGAVRAGDGEQLVVLVAEQAPPSPAAPPEGSWVDSLLRVTGRDTRDAAQPWAEIEAEMGTELPSDYKQLCEAFGVGEFSQVVSVWCADGTRVTDLLRMWRVLLEDDDPLAGPFAPYPIHVPGTTGGLIPWGTSRAADMFFWQVTDGAVDAWPVLARMEDAEEWDRYEMPATEFLYRILTDPGFRPYSVAQAVLEPSFDAV